MVGLPMIGGDYLNHLWKGGTGKLKALVRPLLKDGIGDRMDKGNLWVVPGFTLLVFAILWLTKLSKIALEESNCRGASIYSFEGTQLEEDAKRHCQTAKRYYVGVDEQFSLDPQWRLRREVKNPEWILWFWGPIVFVMYVLTRFFWSLLMENQGINFQNVITASQSVTVEDSDGIREVDEERLLDRLNVIAENFRTAYSSRAFGAFLAFECSLVMAPLVLLCFVLPLMIGAHYRSWGFDIMRAWYEGRDWQGSPLMPFFDFSGRPQNMLVPLIPRYTYCDYHFVSLGNTHTLTYRCYLDANWHERTALFTWVMLVFLSTINFGNLVFWIEWAIRMRSRNQRRSWVTKKWLNADGFTPPELTLMLKFAEGFTMGQLLYFYYIECHTDRVVASAFCTALFGRWLERKKRQRQSMLDNSYVMTPPPPPEGGDDSRELTTPPGWKLFANYPHVTPTAPFATPPSASFSDAPTMAMGGKKSISSSGIPTPKSPAPIPSPLEINQIPSTNALIGSMKGRSPNIAAEIGRESVYGGDRRRSRGRLQRDPKVEPDLPEEDEDQNNCKEDTRLMSSRRDREDEDTESADEKSPARANGFGGNGSGGFGPTATERKNSKEGSVPKSVKKTSAAEDRASVGAGSTGGGSNGKKGKKGRTPPKEMEDDNDNW